MASFSSNLDLNFSPDLFAGSIALAGNPNVGKSTVFNMLTGLNQHTGNWPGKTVGFALGSFLVHGKPYALIDLPGTYSLAANSQEEEITRDFLLSGRANSCILVCDATCLERNLILALQTLEITNNVVLCLNLMDEADKKGFFIDIPALEKRLGIPVVPTNARDGSGLSNLADSVSSLIDSNSFSFASKISYPNEIISAAESLVPVLSDILSSNNISPVPSLFWLALRLLENDRIAISAFSNCFDFDLFSYPLLSDAYVSAINYLSASGFPPDSIHDIIANSIVNSAENICSEILSVNSTVSSRDRALDKFFTGKLTGIPVMILLLGIVFWLTITGANIPSALLTSLFFKIESFLTDLFILLHAPHWLHGALVLGVWRVLSWVVAVMLPPMAIFFPIFSLLEDFGYLPRVAFNLDHHFKKACTCGKQALTMCMGFGCNAAGVVGCRIIDSPREKLIAIITNSFVPCNGRFPTLIAIITMFFLGSFSGAFATVLTAVILASFVIFGITLTFLVSRFLSATFLKGHSSSFALELPPYRAPQLGKVIIRSLFDRTLLVLLRAVKVAAPAGLFIWLLANLTVGNITLLNWCSNTLDPFARLLGLDGVILLAFILGFPANEIVMPIVIMTYLSAGSVLELDSLTELRVLLVSNGWTWVTAVCTMIFTLVHWPCSTTCQTIKKETGSFKWTVLSFLLPSIIGLSSCLLFASSVKLVEYILS